MRAYNIYCLYETPFKGENDRYFYCYQITNLINGKIYIGSHSTKNLNDGYMGSGKILNRAYEKNGTDSFRKNILKFFKTNREMYEYEAKLVTEEFIERHDTYNMVTGGRGAQPGVHNHFYGKHHNEVSKKKIGMGNKNRIYTEEQKERMRMNLPKYKLGTHPEAKRIQKIDLNGNIIIEYECVLVCCEKEEISRPTLLKYIKNEVPCNGYIYKWVDESDYEKTVNFGVIKRRTGGDHPQSKHIIKYDENDNIIAIYGTLKEAVADSEFKTDFCINRSIKTGKVYNGFYYKLMDENQQKEKHKKSTKSYGRHAKAKRVLKIDEEGNIVSIYDTLREASEACGFKSSNSLSHYILKNEPYNGFYYKYEEELSNEQA